MSSAFPNSELFPSQVLLEYEGGEHLFAKPKTQLTYQDMAVELQLQEDEDGHASLKVLVLAERSELRFLRMSWRREIGSYCRFAGGDWCMGDGTSQWRSMDPRRIFPWYVLIRGKEETVAAGVMTQAASFASWNVNPSEITLTLDLRNGACGVRLNGRALEAATVLYCRYERTPMATARRFCGIVSPEPILSSLPIYGILTRPRKGIPYDITQALRECDSLAKLCDGLTNRPFQVIGCGWQSSETGQPQDETCGPWRNGHGGFPEMGEFAEEIRRRGVRPGISMRLLRDRDEALPEECFLPHRPGVLDPSCSEVLEHVQKNVRQAADWGFELFRHVSSTQDCLGDVYRNFQAPRDWSLGDRSRTNAEVLADFYRAIKAAMGDMLVYGEDIVGHLGAGLAHVCRVSQDAPADDWLRSRHNRINGLAFHICQNQSFFTIDAGALDLDAPRKWSDLKPLAELIAASGTAFFVSLPREQIEGTKTGKELSRLFFDASLGDSQVAPADWMDNTCPEEWTVSGQPKCYHWFR